MSATRACGNVPPATSSLYLVLYAYSPHTQTKYVGLQFFLHRNIMHNTPNSEHVMILSHAQLGDVNHQAEVNQGCHFPGVFLVSGWECQRQAQGVGLHRAARSRRTAGHGGIM